VCECITGGIRHRSGDMKKVAEYRLMRKEKDFHYHMTPRLAESQRKKLGLPYDKYVTYGDFFKNEEDEEAFKKIIKEARLPYYKF
jgi:hypothetical protein